MQHFSREKFIYKLSLSMTPRDAGAVIYQGRRRLTDGAEAV
jgi:hypothetical protein